ncbi:MAG: L-threonylcarbamoyladenylate synthase [Candidatus Melainabacteria bacterium]|nr:L-threonylcarbamoyladenylate synthase [Candidatus Melainabacteria bacterium]
MFVTDGSFLQDEIALPQSTNLDAAAKLLAQGQLVAFPTETVYGLGADALNEVALQRLFTAKGRPADHPVIVHLAKQSQLPQWAVEIPDRAWRLAEAFWPGPLTLILKRAAHVPLAVTGGQDTVGLRVPNHPLALALLEAFGSGVAAPSANRFGKLSPTTAQAVLEQLGERVHCVLDGGPCSVGIESTIVAFSATQEVRVLRPGGISLAQLADVLQCPVECLAYPPTAAQQQAEPRVSGSLPSHYAPEASVYLLTPQEIEQALLQRRTHPQASDGKTVAILSYSLPTPADLPSGVLWQTMPANPKDYARWLYHRLRLLDLSGVGCIWVESVPMDRTSAWQGVADRLGRAAAAARPLLSNPSG